MHFCKTNQMMKTRKLTGRIAVLVAMLLVMMTVLASCGGAAQPTLSINGDVFTAFVESKDYNAEKDLKQSELKAIAETVAAAYSAEFDSQEYLIAASRGHNMLAEGFDPNGEEAQQIKPANVEAAKNVIKKANERSSKMSTKELDELLKKFKEKELNALIDSFKVSVNTESNDLWGGLMLGIGTVLRWITTYLGFGNYVVGICVFAILIELLMIPFAIKQQKNSIKQATLRPKEMAIRNKYKGRNDQPTMQKMQAEIQELYQRENFSPASGCLPLLIQLPIIMILYNIVMDPLRYVLGQGQAISGALNTFATTSRAAGGLGQPISSTNGTIELLSNMGGVDSVAERLGEFRFFHFGDGVLDSLENALKSLPNFNIGPIKFGLTPMASGFDGWTAWILLLVPVLTFVTYFVTAKLNRKFMYQPAVNEGMDARQMACSNSMMDITMPAMSAFFTLAVPAVIGVYWAFRSWLGLLKTMIMSKVMPLPTFTVEDYKAAAKEMAGKKAPVKKSENAGKVRSLHFIDDEDFEDTRERGLARRAALEEQERRKQEAKAEKTPFAAAPLKDDKKSDESSAKKNETPINDSLINDVAEPETKENDDQ